MAGNSKRRLFTAEIMQLKSRGLYSDNGGNGGVADNGVFQDRHNEILEAINSLGEKISGVGQVSASVVDDFKREVHESADMKRELQELSNAILETKKEIATLGHPGQDDDHIIAMTNQLDAVVGDTETATNGILSAAESIDNLADRLRDQAKDEEEGAWVDEIRDQVVKIFEACNFQDITGQRINKVVTTLKFIDERVDRMIDILGGDKEFDGLPLPEEVPENADLALLNGPQLENEKKISQDDIDSLFD